MRGAAVLTPPWLRLWQVIAAVFGPHEVNNRADIDNERIVINTEVRVLSLGTPCDAVRRCMCCSP